MVNLSKEQLELCYTRCQNLLKEWRTSYENSKRNSPDAIGERRILDICITQLEEVLTGRYPHKEV